MKEKHYTPDGRHPDDAVWETQKFIKELSRVQDDYFRRLVRDLRLTSDGEDYLFDYVYNCGDGDGLDSFSDYLERYGRCGYDDLVDDATPLEF